MSFPLDDTIAAIASPRGAAARGIVRISGPDVIGCVERVFRADGAIVLSAISRPRVIPGSLVWVEGTSPLPCDLYFWPGRRSYTGQPMAEIHTFGSPPLLEAALRRLCEAGSRLAEPGEFTLRAFLSGRIDLTQAEAVLGVVDAASPRQFDVALAQLAGGLAGPLHRLRDRLLDLLAHLEAGFDFPDEDLPFIPRGELTHALAQAAQTVAGLARQMASRREAAERARVVLVGWPNTGKSSLFNALAGRMGALVSEHPGTTRDYLTAELDLDGAKCLLVDTAGVDRAAQGPDADLRRAAQAASDEQSRAADLRVLCIDATRPLNRWEREELAGDAPGCIVVLTKIDLAGAKPGHRSDSGERVGCVKRTISFVAQTRGAFPAPYGRAIATSSLTGEGIDALRDRLRDAVLTLAASGGDVVASTAVRCGESLRLAAGSLDRARQLVDRRMGEELVAAEVRIALEELGKTVGAVYTDDVLDRVFSRFCIGK
jgi:tRNA modification GTPase